MGFSTFTYMYNAVTHSDRLITGNKGQYYHDNMREMVGEKMGRQEEKGEAGSIMPQNCILENDKHNNNFLKGRIRCLPSIGTIIFRWVQHMAESPMLTSLFQNYRNIEIVLRK